MHNLGEFEGYYQDTFKVEAGFAKQESGYRIEYRLTGPLDQLLIPERAKIAAFRDELWKHTCFEAFLQDAKSPAYWEFNFSPSREWAIYRFKQYRDRVDAETAGIDLVIQQERYPGQLVMKVEIKTKDVIVASRVGLTCVLEHKSETKSYWALRHTEAKPDFHTAESFILNV